MRAGWYELAGPAQDVIEVGDMPTPEPGAGEVLIRLHSSGISPSDYKRRGNVKAGMGFPRIIPHSDGAGVVAGLGAGTSGFTVGDRVWVFEAQYGRAFGTAAEYISLPQFQVRPLPESASFNDGACLGIPAMTAHRAVFMDGPVTGKTVYVPGAASRVGAYCVQFAKWGGARVIGAASSTEKRDAVSALGADCVIDRFEDVAEAVLAATDGIGVDRVTEIEFGGNMAINEKILAEGGIIASYASASQPKATITVSPRRARNMSMHFIFCYTMSDAAKNAACDDIMRAANDGALIHRIAGVHPLDDLALAHQGAETQAGTGQMVVEIP
jgi:NADPH:quinone reductase